MALAQSIWETGVIKKVLHPIGKFNNGEKRYRWGNFEVLIWASQVGGPAEQYIVPTGIVSVAASDLALSPDVQLGREFGYPDGSFIVADPHQADGSDTLIGLHAFGYF